MIHIDKMIHYLALYYFRVFGTLREKNKSKQIFITYFRVYLYFYIWDLFFLDSECLSRSMWRLITRTEAFSSIIDRSIARYVLPKLRGFAHPSPLLQHPTQHLYRNLSTDITKSLMDKASSPSCSPVETSSSGTISVAESAASSNASSPDTAVEEDTGTTVNRKKKRKMFTSVDLEADDLEFIETVNIPGQPIHLMQDNELTKGMKWLENRSKVFVAIDLEYWEVNNKFLTEIGIAIYDTTQIAPDSHPILPKIKACHYVVSENKNKTNGKFVPNNMFKYSYGETLIMPMKECRRAVDGILAAYAKTNNLVIVGHAVGGDIRVLKKNGFKIPEHEVLDTMSIWRLTRKSGFGSLDKLLTYFDIPHGIMHNAGNDAYLNMHLFLALCDPEVRLSKNLDDMEASSLDPETTSGGKKKARRRESITHRSSNAEEAIKLMTQT